MSSKEFVEICVVGSHGCGVSSLVGKVLESASLVAEPSRVSGAHFSQLTVSVSDEQSVVTLCDVSGEAKYRSLLNVWLRRSNAAVVCFNVNSLASFEEAQTLVLSAVERNLVVLLCATHADVADVNNRVPAETSKAFAAFHSVLYQEVSAVTGTNVALAFGMVIKATRQNMKLRSQQQQQLQQQQQVMSAQLLQQSAGLVAAMKPVKLSREDPNWVSDSSVSRCTRCKVLFTAIIRKHHCRHCGQIFCQNCSSKKSNNVRLCEDCFEKDQQKKR